MALCNPSGGYAHNGVGIGSGHKAMRRKRVKTQSVTMTRAELRTTLAIWPRVMAEASDDWAKTFAFSIWNQSENEAWLPSLKQSRVMRKLCRELSARHGTGKVSVSVVE